jgi:hypothetical protein
MIKNSFRRPLPTLHRHLKETGKKKEKKERDSSRDFPLSTRLPAQQQQERGRRGESSKREEKEREREERKKKKENDERGRKGKERKKKRGFASLVYPLPQLRIMFP